MTSTVTVDFVAGLSRFSSQIDKATADLNKFQSNTARISGNINKAFSVLGVGLSFAALGKSINDVAEFADGMGKAAQKAGTTAKSFSELAYAAELSDVQVGTLEDALGQLSKKLEEAKDGSKDAVDLFKRLKIDPKQFTDSAEALKAIADRFNALPDGTVKTRLAKDLGKAFKDLIPLLNEGGEGLKAAADEAARFGKVVDEQAVASSQQFKDNLTRLNTALDGLKINLGTPMVSVLGNYSTAILEATKDTNLFFASIAAFNTIDTNSSNVDKKISETTKKLADLNKFRAELDPDKSFSNKLNDMVFGDVKGLDRSIEETQAELNVLLKMQRDFKRLREAKPAPGDATSTVDSPKPKKGRVASTGKSFAELVAEDNARLIQQFNEAIAPAQTLAEKLQSQLDAYVSLDPAIKSYLQGIADQVRATEQAAAATELWAVHEEQLRAFDEETLAALVEQTAAQEDFSKSIGDYITDLERAIDPTIELADNIGKIQSALSLGLISPEDADRLIEYLETAKDGTGGIADAARDLGLTFTSAFEDAIVGAKSFSEILKGLEADIVRIITRELVTEPLAGAVTGMVKKFDFKSLFSADGNAFDPSGLIPFANGGVVSAATPFAFGGGRLGVMGEAGPEAILPLKRGPNGQLGVQSGGGGINIQGPLMVVNTPDANSFRKSSPQIAADMQRLLNKSRRVG